ncbi:MAG TPA: hypothetical protein V6D25_00590 [Leptolyngbyaceae cyanobacterium]
MDGLAYVELYNQAQIDLNQDSEDEDYGHEQTSTDSSIYNLNEILDSLNLDDEND